MDLQSMGKAFSWVSEGYIREHYSHETSQKAWGNSQAIQLQLGKWLFMMAQTPTSHNFIMPIQAQNYQTQHD